MEKFFSSKLPVLFSIGHSNTDIADFIASLKIFFSENSWAASPGEKMVCGCR
jgi:hypothetical protein